MKRSNHYFNIQIKSKSKNNKKKYYSCLLFFLVKGHQPGSVFLVKSFFLLVTITHGNISPSHCTNTKKRSGVKKTIKIIS